MSPEELLKSYLSAQVPSLVTIRNVHRDMESVERSTGRIKKKYLLLTNRNINLGIFLFYALTHEEAACPKRAKVRISESDYQWKMPGNIVGAESFINLEKVVVLVADSIALKVISKSNGFKEVAKIYQTKLEEIISFAEAVKSSQNIQDEDMRRLIRSALHAEEVSDDFILKYGI